jgi:hypothetical protein
VAFVSTPDKWWNGRHQIEDLSGMCQVVRNPHGTRDSVRYVRDDAVSPPPDLVAEYPEASGESSSDRSLHDGAVLVAVSTGDRGLLDDEATVGDDNHEGRVVEVIRPASVKPCADRLEQPSAQPDDVRSRTQRDPIEIDRCG